MRRAWNCLVQWGRLGLSAYYCADVTRNALSYGAEAGGNLRALLPRWHLPTLYPFVRYDYYNPQGGTSYAQRFKAHQI